MSWSAPDVAEVEIRVGVPDGPLFYCGGPSGEKVTGDWVQYGASFYLQNVSEGRPLTGEHTLARLTVSVAREPFALPPRPVIVVLGSVGGINIGDQAMLMAVVHNLQQLRPDVHIAILLEDPKVCGELANIPNVSVNLSLQFFVQSFLREQGDRPAPAVARLASELLAQRDVIVSGAFPAHIPEEFRPGLRRLMAADGVVDCGGASLSPWWKTYFYKKCLCYGIAGGALLIGGQGVDPLDDPEDVELLARSMGRATEITVRDPLSAASLRAMAPGVAIEITGDDAINSTVFCRVGRPTSAKVRG